MVDILPFPEEAGRRKPDLATPESGRIETVDHSPAEIVIFPGIRIERPDFTLADRLPETGAGKSRGKSKNPHLFRG